MGRTPEFKEKVFETAEGKKKKVKVELFTWEKLDYADKVKKAFKLK
jgi:S-adenosylmethionine synthetase